MNTARFWRAIVGGLSFFFDNLPGCLALPGSAAHGLKRSKPPSFQLGNAATCGSIRTVLKVLRQQRLSGWLCLLGGVLHLLSPLCHGSLGLNRIRVTDALGRETD